MSVPPWAVYWVALSHIPRWKTEKINSLLEKILEQKMSFPDFFHLDSDRFQKEFDLNEIEVTDIQSITEALPSLSFVVEELYDQGFEIVSFNSKAYSQTLRHHLGRKCSPPILYLKGNRELLNQPSVALVGSRNASSLSLLFTKTISQKMARSGKVIINGFAKGVDRVALESCLEVQGGSIAVLPQGILTVSSGLTSYYQAIIEGRLLVLSTFPPRIPWNVGLAMARNVYIYGLSDEIYVAESGPEGGTWSGVVDGLKRGRKIYIRKPEKREHNANLTLITRGAIPVDLAGEPISESSAPPVEHKKEELPRSIKITQSTLPFPEKRE
ncbi:MAG: DNA-processing protein DprA [Atribacterota bacterium]|nr:DNA-processing protein DprA [Candidatus Atribacteria bacterium]